MTPETSNLTVFVVFTLSVIQLKAAPGFPYFWKLVHFLGISGVTNGSGDKSTISLRGYDGSELSSRDGRDEDGQDSAHTLHSN